MACQAQSYPSATHSRISKRSLAVSFCHDFPNSPAALQSRFRNSTGFTCRPVSSSNRRKVLPVKKLAALIPRRVRHAPHCSSTRSDQPARTLCLLRFPDSFPEGEFVASVPLDFAGPFAYLSVVRLATARRLSDGRN